MIIAILALVVGFVAGVLIGRTNKKKVEAALELVKKELEDLKNEVR